MCLGKFCCHNGAAHRNMCGCACVCPHMCLLNAHSCPRHVLGLEGRVINGGLANAVLKWGTNPKVQTIWFPEEEELCPKSKQRLDCTPAFLPSAGSVRFSTSPRISWWSLMIPCPMPAVRGKGSSCFNNPKSRSVTGIKKYPVSPGFCRNPLQEACSWLCPNPQSVYTEQLTVLPWHFLHL